MERSFVARYSHDKDLYTDTEKSIYVLHSNGQVMEKERED